MTFSGYLVETQLVDPVTGEAVLGSNPVVPEDADNLLGGAEEGGCCGGSCCQ